MPSKTSVFAGTSIHLTQMTYQQEAGRAGRRGFDLRGHTVPWLAAGKSGKMLLPRFELPLPDASKSRRWHVLAISKECG